MIVIDCTVLADFYVGEPEQRSSSEALLLVDQHWVSSALIRYEFGSVLQKYVRAGRLEETAMRRALAEAPRLLVEIVDKVDSVEVWNLAMSHKISYYDAAYVWIAQSRKTELYTRDKKLHQKVPESTRLM